jgi:prepilin-type processing-associated H-X9-DG protein
MDSVGPIFWPNNGRPSTPVASPPDVHWENPPTTAPDHWRFLIARHGRGINAVMADGSARWVPLEDTYMLTWNTSWVKYKLSLPTR